MGCLGLTYSSVILLYVFVYFWLYWALIAVWTFSLSCGEEGLVSSCSVQASAVVEHGLWACGL